MFFAVIFIVGIADQYFVIHLNIKFYVNSHIYFYSVCCNSSFISEITLIIPFHQYVKFPLYVLHYNLLFMPYLKKIFCFNNFVSFVQY